jgi:hypothetical protein
VSERERAFGGSAVRRFDSSGTEGVPTAIERFEDLQCWQEARALARIVYALSRNPTFDEDRDLRWQMRAAAVSATDAERKESAVNERSPFEPSNHRTVELPNKRWR